MCDSFVADFTVSYFLALRRGDGAGGDGDKGVDTRTLVTRPVFDEKEISTKLASILAHNIVQKKNLYSWFIFHRKLCQTGSWRQIGIAFFFFTHQTNKKKQLTIFFQQLIYHKPIKKNSFDLKQLNSFHCQSYINFRNIWRFTNNRMQNKQFTIIFICLLPSLCDGAIVWNGN